MDHLCFYYAFLIDHSRKRRLERSTRAANVPLLSLPLAFPPFSVIEAILFRVVVDSFRFVSIIFFIGDIVLIVSMSLDRSWRRRMNGIVISVGEAALVGAVVAVVAKKEALVDRVDGATALSEYFIIIIRFLIDNCR